MRDKLRQQELNRFASAFKEQESQYKVQQEQWLRFSIGATLLLLSAIAVSISGPYITIGANWYSEPSFYLINFVFVTLFIYSLKQHSHLGNLRVDYANRGTLAQAYQHIIDDDSEEDHSEVKDEFIKQAAKIFTSSAMFKSSDVTLYEALLSRVISKKE